MERPSDKRESLQKFEAQRSAMRNAVARPAGSDSDAVVLRQLAVFAYSMKNDDAESADPEEGSDR